MHKHIHGYKACLNTENTSCGMKQFYFNAHLVLIQLDHYDNYPSSIQTSLTSNLEKKYLILYVVNSLHPLVFHMSQYKEFRRGTLLVIEEWQINDNEA